MPISTRPRATPSSGAADTEPPSAPSAWLMLLEARAVWELGALIAAAPWLRRLPRGDGHPVLVLPGMGANDWSTVPLRKLLQSLGYSTHGWRQGFNVGPRDGVLARCASDLTALARRHGRPVTLVGWSLGGLYARELAKVLPHCTRAVITLGTPFAGHPRATNAWRVFEFLSGQSSHDPAMIARLREPPPVPTTSLYSRTDGVVAWQCSLNEPGPMAENIEVPASHTGMGVSPLALYVLAERLAQPRERWKPFVARGAGRWVFRTDAAPAPAVGR